MKLQEEIAELTDNLLYPSESDEPVHPVIWREIEQLTPQELLALTGENGEVKQQGVNQFFAAVTQEEDWFGEEERHTCHRFRQLRELLEKQLKDLRVYRVGKGEAKVYLVGKAADGSWQGVETVVVET